MATRNTDVNLVIRAKNEASAGIKSVSESLKTLISASGEAAANADKLGAGLTQFEKLGSKLTGSIDASSDAISRQAKTLLSTSGAIAESKNRVGELTRALGLLEAQSNKKFIGPTIFGSQDDIAKQLRTVKTALAGAEGDVAKLTRAFDQQFAGLQQSRGAYREVQAAQRETAAAIDTVTAALGRQQKARAAASVADTVNRTTGVSRTAATDNGATFEALDRQAAASERAAEAERSRANAITLANNALRARARRSTDDGTTAPKASATALADLLREEDATEKLAAAERDRAAAAELTNNALRARARTQVDDTPAPRAANTALADLLREEDARAARIQRITDAMNPLVAVQRRLDEQLKQLRTDYAATGRSADQLAAAEKHLRDEADRAAKALGQQTVGGSKPALFGLKPYELTNLGYQVNDVVTQLASGTSLTQTLAQQGGQILQIFPKVGASIVAAFTNPAVIAFAATLGTIVLTLKAAADQAERLRGFNAILAASANGSNYNAAGLEKATKALREYGVSAEDAKAGFVDFIKNGVDQSRFVQLESSAKDLADVFGVDLKQALSSVAEAFSGGYAAITKLDDSYNFLTASQREYIRTLFDEGRAGEGRAEALRIFSEKQNEAAKNARGPWADAIRELKNTYRGLIDELADTSWFQGLNQAFVNLGKTLTTVLRDVRGTTDAAVTAQQIASKQSSIDALKKGPQTDLTRIQLLDDERALETLKKRYQEITGAAYDAAKAQQTVSAKDPKGNGGSADKQAADELARLSTEQQLEKLRDKSSKNQAVLSAAEAQRRIQIAGQLAYSEEIERSGNKQLATAKQQIAAEKERGDVLKANDDNAKRAVAEREKQINQFEGRVVGAEGGMGKNPFGSASGYAQFTSGTYLEQYKKTYGDTGQSKDAILLTRQNATIAKGVLDTYTRGNADFLEKFGAQITAGNLYLVHFLGRGGAGKVLRDPGAGVDKSLRGVADYDKVLSGNQGYLFDKSKKRYRTGTELQALLAKRVGGDTGSPQSSGQVAVADLLQEQQDSQQALTNEIDRGNAATRQRTDELNKQASLQGKALLDAQALAAADEAERRLLDDLAKKNDERTKQGHELLTVTEAQVKATRDAAAAAVATPQATVQAQLADRQRPVNDLQDQRDALLGRFEQLRSIGDQAGAAALEPQIAGVNAELRLAIDNLAQFYAGLSSIQAADLGLTVAQLEAIRLKLEQSKTAAVDVKTIMGLTGQEIARAFSNSVVSAVDRFVQAIDSGEKATKAAKDAFLDFAASFLRQIAQMIIQQLAFTAAKSILGSFGVPVAHAGGVIGGGVNRSRSVSADVFAGAQRFHTGGVVGLAPDEVPAILQRGEEVVTRDDPRNRLNGGLGGGAPVEGGGSGPSSVKVVNVFNPSDVLAHSLSDRVGEKTMLNFVKNNAAAFKAAIGR